MVLPRTSIVVPPNRGPASWRAPTSFRGRGPETQTRDMREFFGTQLFSSILAVVPPSGDQPTAPLLSAGTTAFQQTLKLF